MILLILLFVLVPIAELWAILQVGAAIGVLPTIALLIADSILGSMLLRAQGRRAWTRLRDTLAAGRVPTTEVADGALIMFGGALMLTPGFLTDILGILLLLPPTRALLRPRLLRRVAIFPAAGGSRARRPRRAPVTGMGRPGAPGNDVDGTIADDEAGALPR